MLASFADNHKNIEMRNIIAPIVLLVIALSAILYLIPGSALFVLFLVVTIFSIMSSIMPLMNSLAFVFEQHGIEINYGLARGLGSVAYAIASLVLGHVVESFSPGILPLFYIIFTALLFVVVKMFVLPKGYEKEVVKEDTKQEETEQLSFGKFCMKYKKLQISVEQVLIWEMLFSLQQCWNFQQWLSLQRCLKKLIVEHLLNFQF